MTKLSKTLAMALAGTLAACGAENGNEANQAAAVGPEMNMTAEASSPLADAENLMNEPVNHAMHESSAKPTVQAKAEPAPAPAPAEKAKAAPATKPKASAPAAKPVPEAATAEPKPAAPSTSSCPPEHHAMGHC